MRCLVLCVSLLAIAPVSASADGRVARQPTSRVARAMLRVGGRVSPRLRARSAAADSNAAELRLEAASLEAQLRSNQLTDARAAEAKAHEDGRMELARIEGEVRALDAERQRASSEFASAQASRDVRRAARSQIRRIDRAQRDLQTRQATIRHALSGRDDIAGSGMSSATSLFAIGVSLMSSGINNGSLDLQSATHWALTGASFAFGLAPAISMLVGDARRARGYAPPLRALRRGSVVRAERLADAAQQELQNARAAVEELQTRAQARASQ